MKELTYAQMEAVSGGNPYIYMVPEVNENNAVAMDAFADWFIKQWNFSWTALGKAQHMKSKILMSEQHLDTQMDLNVVIWSILAGGSPYAAIKGATIAGNIVYWFWDSLIKNYFDS